MEASIARIVLFAILLIAGIAAFVGIFQQQRESRPSKKEQSGKQEAQEELSFVEPSKIQSACPQGGEHDWIFEESLTRLEYPPGEDACTENLIFADEVEYTTWHCAKCGEQREERTVVSEGQSWGRD